jgi:ferric-dicitrate binding protein FerR (iron transport regulator)
MKYDNYMVEDFLLDENFRRWVLYPDQVNRFFWEKWIKENHEKLGLVEEARNIILSVEYDEAEIYESKNIEMWERLNNKIEAGQDKRHFLKAEVQEQKNKSFKGNFNYAILYRAAAVFIGVLLLSVAYYFAAGVNTYKEYATNYGEIKTIMLPDSSQVTLNANSTLSFNIGWSTDNPREVWIEGESFFTVRKKPHAGNAKFVVHANNLNVEVLGTKFNVNNRRGKTTVVLNSGKVKLKTDQSGADSLIMNPGELAEFSEYAGEFTTKLVETEVYTSWRNNKLIFNGNSIREISRILEDNYGFEVIIKDKGLSGRKFKGTFPADSPDILLTALSESFNLKVTQKDNQITIENY